MSNMTDFEGCVPRWSIQGKQCIHGSRVSLPGCSFTMPKEGSVWTGIAGLYSALPFFCVVVTVVLFLRRRKPRELCWLLCSLSTTSFAVCMERLLKERRPESCLTSCGMPSGHSAFSLSFLLFVLGWDSLSRVPRVDADSSNQRRLARKVALALLMLPVPWSRVVLGDHTARQAFAGCIVGALGALLWLLCFGPCCEGFINRLLRRGAQPQPAAAAGGVGSVGGVGGGREPVLDRSLLSPGLELSLPKEGEPAARV